MARRKLFNQMDHHQSQKTNESIVQLKLAIISKKYLTSFNSGLLQFSLTILPSGAIKNKFR